MLFTEAQYLEAVEKLGCDIDAIKAVAEVESDGRGFTANGRLMCLFEGHKFHKFTKGRFSKSHPTLSYPVWVKKYYKKSYDKEYSERFSAAFLLDPDAAMMATSWGAFQIMGEHHNDCGFDTVGEFLDFLKADIGNHLRAFVAFINHNNAMKQALQEKNWQKFAYRYNGEGYRQNDYDRKMAEAYKDFKDGNQNDNVC
jgi:N-acetylmuramidase